MESGKGLGIPAWNGEDWLSFRPLDNTEMIPSTHQYIIYISPIVSFRIARTLLMSWQIFFGRLVLYFCVSVLLVLFIRTIMEL